MHAWQFPKAQEVARANNLTPFISMQDHLNLIYREEECEMQPLCVDQGVALTPYSPLAAGRLARPFGTVTKRLQSDSIAISKYEHGFESDVVIINRVEELSKKYNTSMSAISLAWIYSKDGVVAPIIGASKTKYIDEAIPALDVVLSIEDIAYLEKPYTPRALVGPL